MFRRKEHRFADKTMRHLRALGQISLKSAHTVMPGTRVGPSAGPGVNLVAGIHVLLSKTPCKDVDGRDKPDKPGHDERV
jgi:hypothetical protein